jgi:FtsP/CotA-like multicopper oxidase with cupredoxin domain
MAKGQGLFAASRRLGPRASRRSLLQSGLAFGALALGGRDALGQSHGAHAHMPELGVAKVPAAPAMDQPLIEPEVRCSANGVLSTSLRCAYAYRDIGGVRLYLRSYEGGLAPTLRMKPGETLKVRLINDLPPNRDILPSNPRIHISSTTRTSTSMARTAARAVSPTTSCARWRPASRTTSR